MSVDNNTRISPISAYVYIFVDNGQRSEWKKSEASKTNQHRCETWNTN